MTIKLLAAYGKYPPNAIITLDSTTETSLITDKVATATLTGGTVWVDPNVSNPLPGFGDSGTLGPVADLTALNSTYPAASNAGKLALVGSVAPYSIYECDGSVWTLHVFGGGGSGTPAYTATANVTATTSATPNDATFAAFAAASCNALIIENYTRQDIDIKRSGSSSIITIPAGTSRTVAGITDASQVGLRRSDYVVTGQTRTLTLTAQAVTGGTVYTGISTLNQAITNGGSWATFPNTACVAMELINTSGKDIQYRLNGAGTVVRVKHNSSVMIYGITNANQVGIQAVDNVVGFNRSVQAEVYAAATPSASFSTFRRAAILDEARVEFNDLFYPNAHPKGFMFGPAMARERRRLVKKGLKPLAMFTDAATVISNASAQLANVTSQGEFMYGQSAVEFTQAAAGTFNFYPPAALSSPVNVSQGTIHLRYAFPRGTVPYTGTGIGTVKIRLYSGAATPASPGTVYMEASLGFQWSDCALNPSGGSGNPVQIDGFALAISKFTQVGAGTTDLTQITFASLHLVSTQSTVNGAKMRLFDISYVPRSRTVGSVIFTFDDIHWGQYSYVAPKLAAYGWPGVLCIDSIRKVVSEQAAITYNGSSPIMSYDNMLTLQNQFGWQLTHQVYDIDASVERSPDEWMRTAEKASEYLLAMGACGTADTSFGSASNSNIDDERFAAAKRMYRSAMLFKGGNAANGGATTPPRAYGEQLPFGNPYRIQRLNMGGLSGFVAGGGNYFNTWKNHVDQAVADKGVAIFAAHSEFNGVSPTGELIDDFNTLLAYIKTLEDAGTCEVHTLDSLIRKVYD